MNNPVAQSVADFLKHYPPFGSLSHEELFEVSLQIKIKTLEKNEILFKSGSLTHNDFYIVKTGTIGLSLTADAEEALIDKCDEGDILGLRPIFAKNDYLLTAKAREDAIVYALAVSVFKGLAIKKPQVLEFILQSLASQTRNPYDSERKGKLLSENAIVSEQVADIQYFQPIKHTKNPITANPDDMLMFIAKTMASSTVGSVIIQESQLPIGIITDRDLRSKIATGLFPITSEAKDVMTSPVITVPENISVAEAQMIMLKHNVGHLCVTKDGSDKSAIVGIISEHDVVLAQANTPGVLLKQTRRATNNKELKYVREKLTDLVQNSIDKNIPISHISNIVSEINIALTRRAIELAVEKIGTPPPVRFTWITVGSQGRKEQLLKTDQDNALIFEDVESQQYDTVKRYFLELAEYVTDSLYKIGYEFSPHNIMARNSQWCKSVTDWLNQYNTWINNPMEKGVELSTLFFDFDFIYGYPAIEDVLVENIKSKMLKNKKFFAFLAADTLKNPAPLGFFRQFLVEGDGEYKDTFDIKARALEPLIDAARVLLLNHGITDITNTYHRFKKLAELEPKHTDLFDECAEAFNTLQHFRTEEGLKNDSNGRYISLDTLSKTDKNKLKSAFQPISDVHDIIKNRFSITYLS